MRVMFRFDVAVLAAALLAASAGSALAEWRLEAIETKAPVTAVSAAKDGVAVRLGKDWNRLSLNAGALVLSADNEPERVAVPAGGLYDGVVATGTKDIARVWLAEPNTRYIHAVLGDAVEAGSLIVLDPDGQRTTLRLGVDAVFEDLTPRIVDLDGDGKDEILLVKSYVAQGSALAVIGLREGRPRILAETPPIGRAQAWLNPAGVADFDGDGHTDIALVRQPHVAGALEVWTWRDGALSKKAEMSDTSNHVIGSRDLSMSAVADVNGDGVADLAIPSLDRASLRLLTFRPAPAELARVKLPARVVSNIAVLKENSGAPIFVMGLQNGRLVAVRNVN